ncbi:MAG: GAF domain-containing sensor histidine kinase [Gemmatimonadales bacterium]|nr:GAF domain-containing sensor histidine kinase [Gemmatimonadales bacterium]
MEPHVPVATTELAAAILQLAITLALAALSARLYQTYRKPYLAWWTAAWSLFGVRVLVIMTFLLTGRWGWLYWHQVLTGWTALALLTASLFFAGRAPRRWWVAALWTFPPVWSYVAIYELDIFFWAALPAVVFLSLATLWAGVTFLRYDRQVRSGGARLLGVAFVLWGLHHLDYPWLRARGAWNPWGYYLDICFELAVGGGLLLLVADDLRRGIGALVALAGDLQPPAEDADALGALLARPLQLPGVRGSAFVRAGDGDVPVRGAGAAASWAGAPLPSSLGTLVARARTGGRPQVGDTPEGRRGFAYAAALPVMQGERAVGVLLLVGDARDPFTALDEAFLVALGRQVGAALAQGDLTRRLAARTADLERLSTRMVQQHEEERRRLSRELHDETAQVFAAVKLELGGLRGLVGDAGRERLARAVQLVDTGIRGIRNVVNDLRPSLLDDLGLLPALRSLAAEFGERSGLAVALELPDALPPLAHEAELALFRALQEALANVARHAGATRVTIAVAPGARGLELVVTDDGRGPAAGHDAALLEARGHMGLAGMRERIGALGGDVRLAGRAGGGATLTVRLPLAAAPAA